MTALVLYSAELDALVELDWLDDAWRFVIDAEFLRVSGGHFPSAYDWTLVGEL
jgi:hypothetical protein